MTTTSQFKWSDYCRRWKITDLGAGNWGSRFDIDAVFIIVRSKKVYRFIPINGVKAPMAEQQLQKDDATRSLVGEFSGTRVSFSIEDTTPDFMIGLDDPDKPHGGPHGVDH